MIKLPIDLDAATKQCQVMPPEAEARERAGEIRAKIKELVEEHNINEATQRMRKWLMEGNE